MNRRYLNIGSWNIEHFGKIDDNDENQYAIAEHIELSGVDILALQELYVTEKENMSNIHLRKSLDLVEEHTGNKWGYEIFPNRSSNDTSQLCGVAWNKAKVSKDKTFKIPVETQVYYEGEKLWLWDRLPHAVKFLTEENKSDVVVIPIHMKSNVGHWHIVMRKRFEEAKTLINCIDLVKQKMEDEDIIILGDTNCKARTEDAIQAIVKEGLKT